MEKRNRTDDSRQTEAGRLTINVGWGLVPQQASFPEDMTQSMIAWHLLSPDLVFKCLDCCGLAVPEHKLLDTASQ